MEEAGGFKLFLSDKNPTGYMGVRQSGPGRFTASRRSVRENGGDHIHLGTFDTAVEAAIAYAADIHRGEARGERDPLGDRDPSVYRPNGRSPPVSLARHPLDNGGSEEGEEYDDEYYLHHESLQWGGTAGGGGRAHLQTVVTQEPLVREAGGYKLWLSNKSSSGYLGVYRERRTGRWKVEYKKVGGFGMHDTAVQAAVAYAKRAAQDGEYADGGVGGGGDGMEEVYDMLDDDRYAVDEDEQRRRAALPPAGALYPSYRIGETMNYAYTVKPPPQVPDALVASLKASIARRSGERTDLSYDGFRDSRSVSGGSRSKGHAAVVELKRLRLVRCLSWAMMCIVWRLCLLYGTRTREEGGSS